MKRNTYIEGFWERVRKVLNESPEPVSKIARECKFDRKVFYPSEQQIMSPAFITRFCTYTKTDANWLLGVKRVAEPSDIEMLQETICDNYCKWVVKINALSKIEPEEAEHLQLVLNKICESCPLKRL